MISLLVSDLQILLAAMAKSLDSIRKKVGSEGAFDEDLALFECALEGAHYICRELTPFREAERAEAGALNLNMFITGTRGILERIVGPNIRLSLVLGAVNPVVAADAVILECVLVHLATNGRDAMPYGGTLTIETTSVEMVIVEQLTTSTHSRLYVRLTVSDSGAGTPPIPRSEMTESSYTAKKDLPGIGLTNVVMNVRRLGGFVELERESQSGTRAHVYVPVVETDRN